ncbi:ribitol-5-phosphate xylosyltransferase 1-like [Rhodnius prolixus]|uniref:Putative ribitol-5-phosphate beta14-xylosyltransferase-like isoform x1 n=1 Tax=Rhodnius prolixus TaxID=13249 RepID=A0A4P6DFL1_RHOPR
MYKRLLKFISLLYILLVFTLFLLTNFSNLKAYLRGKTKIEDRRVQIWSKAAIGQYLWSHILNGSLEVVNNGFYQNGNVSISGMTFDYFSGPGYIQTTLPQNVRYLILVLNGRTSEHSLKALEWLEYLYRLQALRKLAVILLGNEGCEDDWIVKHLKSKGGIIDVLFIVYDSPLVDDEEVFQWPLGVATYRGFPNVDTSYLKVARKYTCNFIGTVYKNSSREKLVEALNKSHLSKKCYVESRERWLPNETEESLNKYINILSRSFLTLSPAGKNPECYRLYEAISLGSVPVVVMEPPQGRCVNPPLRLLFRYNAPIIKLSSWDEAIRLLAKTNLDLPITSVELLAWYASFKKQIATALINKIEHKFFNPF